MKRKKAACGKATLSVDQQLCYRRLRFGSSLFHPKSRCIYSRPANRIQMSHSELEVQR